MDTQTTVTGQQEGASESIQREPTPYEVEVLKREQQSISNVLEQGSYADDGSEEEEYGISQ
jgi:hypothetical protein